MYSTPMSEMQAFVGLFDPESDSLPESLPPEPGEGNVEYKLKLVNPSKSRFEHLVTQMKWRLREGQGEAIYEIGVEDSGLMAGLNEEEIGASLETLGQMAEELGATISILRERLIEDEHGRPPRKAAEVLVRKVPDDQHTIDLRVAVLGNVDAGKSTLLGVLTKGELDNGRGRARLNLFRHLHEIQSGRTSSISHEILGFGAQGDVINHQHRLQTAEEICEASAKLITFIDLAGHQKYLRTTIFGLTGYCPHFAMLVVSASAGVAGTTREHLGLSVALRVPLFVVVSKTDVCPPSALEHTLAQLEALLRSPGCRRVPVRVSAEDDALTAAGHMQAGNVVPVFAVSSVSGRGLDLLTRFLNLLPPCSSAPELDNLVQEPTEFCVDETYHVPGVGPVLGGLLTRGVLRESDRLLLGPTDNGAFVPVEVHSVHRNRAPCRLVRAGQGASVAIGGEGANAVVRKGMMLLDPSIKPQACLFFQANINVLFHSTAIYHGFQTTVYIGNIRQTATVEGIMAKQSIQTNERATVMFKFIKHPEHLHVGSQLFFREGSTKGIGHVTQVFPLEWHVQR